MRPLCFAIALLPLGALTACGDPVREKAIDALGGEQPGVRAGPLHRGGQPCVLCHGGTGPGNSVFSLAGTVYQTDGAKVPLAEALVKFIDSAGKVFHAGTNCAGNFFVMETDYAPSFPVWVKVEYGFQLLPGMGPGAPPVRAPIARVMGSPIYREGSCAKCHGDKAAAESVGPVYFAPQGAPFSPPGCPP